MSAAWVRAATAGRVGGDGHQGRDNGVCVGTKQKKQVCKSDVHSTRAAAAPAGLLTPDKRSPLTSLSFLYLLISPANDLPLCRDASRGFGLRKLAPNWKKRTRQLNKSRGESCAKGHPMVAGFSALGRAHTEWDEVVPFALFVCRPSPLSVQAFLPLAALLFTPANSACQVCRGKGGDSPRGSSVETCIYIPLYCVWTPIRLRCVERYMD